jgi:hypothetical protein
MKIITSQQQKEDKKQGNDISKLPAGSIHANNKQEIARHMVHNSVRRIIQNSFAFNDKRNGLKDIAMVAELNGVTVNPRKLWRRFAKDFI